jgi:hypothetical protein
MESASQNNAPKHLRWTDSFTPGRFALLLGLLIFGCFPSVIFGRETFFFRDFGFFSYPLAAYHRDAFWHGEVPLWNPYNDCGIPFLAQWNTMVFYPGSLIYLLLPMPWSLNLFCLLHFFLAGMGMFFLARSWCENGIGAAVAGLAYVFGGVLLSCLKWPNNIAALCLMPWVVLFVWRALNGSKRQMVMAVLIGASQMLAGAPEVIILTWLTVAVMVLAMLRQTENRIGLGIRLFLIGSGVAGLCAAQLFPFMDLLAHSQRDAGFARSQWPMPIWGWANFLVPLFHTFASYHGVHAQPEQYWISSYYVPLVAVSFAVFGALKASGLKMKYLLGLTIFCLVMCLGDAGIVYKISRRIFPFLGVMRFPIKFVVVPAFTIPLLAGAGASRLTEEKKLPRVFFLLAVGFGVGIAAITSFAAFQPHPLENVRSTIINGGMRFAMLALTILVFLFLLREAKARIKMALAYLFLSLLAADGLTHAPWQNPTAPAWVFDSGIPQFELKPEVGKSRAMISSEALDKMDHLAYSTPVEDITASRLALFSNCNLIDQIPKVDGFYALYSKQNHILDLILYGRTNIAYEPLMNFLSVTHVTTPGKTVNWETRSTAMPWLTVGQESRAIAVESAITSLTSPSFAPAEVVFLTSRDQAATVAANPSAQVLSTNFAAEKIRAEVKTDRPTMLVLNQTWYHWWKATIDDQPTPILPANLAFQAVVVPAGQHVVQFRYVDQTFFIGATLTALTACSLLVCFLRRSA